MAISAENKMRIGLAAALFILLLAGMVASQSTQRSSAAFQRVDHTREVIFQLDQMFISVLGTDSARRGYLITGERRFLDSLPQEQTRIRESVRAIQLLIADNVVQQRRLATVEELLRQKDVPVEEIKKLRESAVSASTGLVRQLDESQAVTEKIRGQVEQMEKQERILLQQRSDVAREFSRKSNGVVFCGSLLAVLFVGLAGLMAQRDAKKRLQAEKNAQAARAYAEQVVDAVSEPLLAIDRDLRARSANRAFYQQFRLTPPEIEGKALPEISNGAWNIPQLREFVAATVARNGQIDKLEMEHTFPMLGRRTMLVTGRPFVASETGKPMLLLVFEDVTEQKQSLAVIAKLNVDLNARATQLEVTNKELEAFSYSVSHDLRAPVRHIHGFVDLLRKHSGQGLDEKGLRYLNTIAESARQMGRLIDDLLSFSRMGRAAMRHEVVDLNQLVEDSRRSQQMDTQDRSIVWESVPLPKVTGDRALLRMVFDNLLANAVKYTRGRQPARIDIGVREGTDETIVFVRDNGVGFDMQYAHKLFGVFQRLHGADQFEGTGIGLANVRRIIARHGGRTWAESKPEEGATFYFSLPNSNKE